MEVELKPLPPEDALRFFERKGYKFGAGAFDWRDTWQAEHATMFTVAKATGLDVLADIREAVDKAIRNGETLETFTRSLRPLLEAKGWWGRKTMTDPVSGEEGPVQLGNPRRLKTIFEVNTRMAYAAGHWQAIQRAASVQPYLRYVAIQDHRTRPDHLRWHGAILPISHTWWDTHYPPNGWHCRCTVMQLGETEMRRYGFAPSQAEPDGGMIPWTNGRSGLPMLVPEGIDPGFSYNVGKAARQFDPAMLQELPVAEPVPTYRDHGLLPVKQIAATRSAPARWETAAQLDARGLGGAAEIERKFRELFEIPEDKDEAVVTDPHGMQVVFNTGLLRYMLSKQQGREAFLPLARRTVENPDEIWLTPFRKADGRVVMRKRYIALFNDSGGSPRRYLLVVERHRDGWGIWNAYPNQSLDAQRTGYLIFPGNG